MWQNIQGWIIFRVGGRCYDIFVEEVGSEVYSRSCFNYNIQNKGDLEASSSSTSEEVSWQKEDSMHSIPRDEEDAKKSNDL